MSNQADKLANEIKDAQTICRDFHKNGKGDAVYVAKLADEYLGKSLAAFKDSQPSDDDFLGKVRERLEKAREKYPSPNAMSLGILEEAGEVGKALVKESPERVYDECIDLAVMAMRLAEEGDPHSDVFRKSRGLAPTAAITRLSKLKPQDTSDDELIDLARMDAR